MASLIFNWKLVQEESKILKQSSGHREGQFIRTSQVLKDVEMFFRREMFTDVSGEVSIGFTNITDTAACTDEKFGLKTHHFEGTRFFGVSSKFLE